MTIQNRITIFMFAMLTLVVIPIVSAGYIFINAITSRLNEESLTRELNNINMKIRELYKELEDANSLDQKEIVAQEQYKLLKKLSDYKFGKTGHLFILDEHSKVLLHDNFKKDQVFNFKFAQQMLEQHKGTLEYEYQGKSYFCVFMTSIQWNWILALAITEDEMFEGRLLYLQFVVIFCALVLFCVLLLSSLLTEGTSKKIDTTLYYLKQFENGNLDAYIPSVSRDEIGTIQAGINSMIAKVAGANRSMLHEIEQRKRIEQELRHQEELLRQINMELNRFKMTLDMTLDCVFMFDAETLHFSYVNQGAINQFGYVQEELLQMTVPDIYPDFTKDSIQTLLAPLVKGKHPALTVETVHRHKDNTLIQVEAFLQFVQISSLSEEENGDALFLAIVRDITERKLAEAKLQQAKETAEQAQRAAESANRAKSTFLANMSHELRTPLNGILGYTQILKRDKTLTPKQIEAISVIHRSGEHLLTLINDILDLSKIEAGRLELIPSEFRFPEFLKNIADLFKMQAEQKGISFVYEEVPYPVTASGNDSGIYAPLISQEPLPAAVHADEKRLRQILLNLISNAIKFTKQGQVIFQVSCHQDKCLFAVNDTGTGIPEDQLGIIFLPFRQVDNPGHYIEGTGLGLSISKKLVDMMGGQLRVKSQLGQGSTFFFEIVLPKVKGFVDTHAPPLPHIIAYQPKEKGKVFKILVVDDKWENRTVFINLLKELGFDFAEAQDGAEALKVAQQYLPDLIILDLVMPVMDGFELARQVRQLEGDLKNVIMIAASASVFDCHQRESIDAGCNEFVAKPVRTDTLLNLLKKYLPLEWIYEENQETSEEAHALSSMTMVGPSSEQANVLLELALKGNIKKIVDYAGQLKQQNAQLKPFAEEILKMAKKFEISKIKEFVKKYVL